MAGEKTRSVPASLVRSSADQKPTARPASAAAPSAVLSWMRGRSTGTPSQVGLELQQEVVVRRAAVGAQRGHVDARRAAHGVEHRAGLEADGLLGGPGQMLRPGATGEPDQQPAGVGVPVGGAEAGERGHEVDAAVVGGAGGQRADVGRVRR